MQKSLLIGAVILTSLSFSDAAQALDSSNMPVMVTPLTAHSKTASGQPITLPQKNVQVVVSSFEIASGATLPVHQHPFPRYAYVQGGTLKVTNIESDESTIYQAGDFVVEMIGQWHKAANIGADPVKLLVIDQIEEGAEQTIFQ